MGGEKKGSGSGHILHFLPIINVYSYSEWDNVAFSSISSAVGACRSCSDESAAVVLGAPD